MFQQGGNDGENTLIRHDAAGYQTYAATRTVASGINIPQAQLLPVQPARGGPPYGFHPACAPLQSLFNQKKLAVVANVGMLAQPSSKPGLETQGAPRPANLFSHSDQELAVQSGVHTGFERVGWGGRIADLLDAANPGTLFPPMISTNGLRTYVSGRTSVPLTVPSNPYFTLYSSGEGYYQYDVLRDAALREMLAQSRGNLYDVVAQLYAEEGMAASSVVFPILQNKNSVVAPFFASLDTDVGRQFKTIAQLIEGRAQTQMRRQVFYAHQWGYDTHGSQAGLHNGLLQDFAAEPQGVPGRDGSAGLGNSVTTFSLSEFGRTFKPASNQGTDHGWGNYAFVAGGASAAATSTARCPRRRSTAPTTSAGRPLDPATSVEQYGATPPLVRHRRGRPAVRLPNLGASAKRRAATTAPACRNRRSAPTAMSRSRAAAAGANDDRTRSS